MADKVKQELLSSDKIQEFWQASWAEQDTGVEPDEEEIKALKTFLAKAAPLIRKDERARIDNIRAKALEVIEHLTCHDEFGMSDTRECKLLTKIYMFSHIATSRCENPHEGWVKELETLWQALKEDKR